MSRPDRKPRIVVAGAGIAGGLIAWGLRDRPDCELICLEQVGPDDQSDAGTGLNMGPNAIKCLRAHIPDAAETIVADRLPWEIWTVALTDGRPLMDLRLKSVADNPGVRIRWAELYALLREPLRSVIIYNAEVTDCGEGARRNFRVLDRPHRGRLTPSSTASICWSPETAATL